jgi:hypothetical protein
MSNDSIRIDMKNAMGGSGIAQIKKAVAGAAGGAHSVNVLRK